MVRVLLGLDTGVRDLAGVDHLVHQLDRALAGWPGTAERASYVASTHVVSPGGPHHAVAAGWEADPAAGAGPSAAGLAAVLPGAGVVLDDGSTRTVAGPALLVEGAEEARGRHATRASGRLVRFPGQEAVERRLSAAEAVALSCIDEVAGLAGTEVTPDALVDLTGFARPTWREGRCVLLVQSAATGLVPFETAHQIACCAEH